VLLEDQTRAHGLVVQPLQHLKTPLEGVGSCRTTRKVALKLVYAVVY
jgi:hypothetical protein